MFQFAGSPSRSYVFTTGCPGSSRAGLPIQKSLDQWVCAPPQGLSQLVTSFFGSQCQGIRPAPLQLDLLHPPRASVRRGRFLLFVLGYS
jgi:hypothetical protein